MRIKPVFQTMMFNILLAVCLISGIGADGIAGEPPPAGSTTGGKTASGVLTATIIFIHNEPVVVASIVGECEKTEFVIGPIVNNPISPKNIGRLTATDIEAQYLQDADTAGCYSDLGTDDVVITAVKSFINTGSAISAQVNIQAVVPAP